MSARIYDFASRRPLESAQDTEANEKVDGTYIGNIGKENAQAFRSTLAVLESLAQRISDLTDEMDDIGGVHYGNVEYILQLLNKEESFDIENEDLMVGENGHVWIVKAPIPMYEEED